MKWIHKRLNWINDYRIEWNYFGAFSGSMYELSSSIFHILLSMWFWTSAAALGAATHALTRSQSWIVSSIASGIFLRSYSKSSAVEK